MRLCLLGGPLGGMGEALRSLWGEEKKNKRGNRRKGDQSKKAT